MDVLRLLLIDDQHQRRARVRLAFHQLLPTAVITAVADPTEIAPVTEPASFDVVLVSDSLGWSDCLAFLRLLKAYGIQQPVVMYGSDAGVEEVVAAMHAGLNDYVRTNGQSYLRLPSAVMAALSHAPNRARSVGELPTAQGLLEPDALEHALHRSETILGKVVDNTPITLIVLDVTGMCIAAAGQVPGSFALDAKHLIGQSLYQIFSTTPQLLAQMHASLAGKHFAATAMIARRTYEISSSTIYDMTGVPDGILYIVFDVSEQVELEAQLRHIQRMESVGQLAASIAHDLNNVLTGITGHADLALNELMPEHAAYENIDQIQKVVRRANALTRQLLTFARRQTLAMERLDPNQLIRDVTPLLQRIAGIDITIQLELADDLVPIWGDATQLEQVLMNLVANARDAMSTGGMLTITTANILFDTSFIQHHQGAAEGRYTMVAIIDTGSGMDEAVKTHLFEPFFTTKPPSKGTGLGLATCFSIIKQHHGYIIVDSEPGCGTKVTLYLPSAATTSGCLSG